MSKAMAGTCKTVQGDSFDSIAFRLWGDEHLCSLLMAANPDYMDVLLFGPGVELKVPDFTPKPAEADLPPWYGETNA